MRFIRKNGRVIPIRDENATHLQRAAHGAEKGSKIGAVTVGALYSLSEARFHPVGTPFWALKGAAAGAAIGAVSGAIVGKKGSRINDSEKLARQAFSTSFKLAAAASLAKVAKPFVRNKAIGTALYSVNILGSIGSIAVPFVKSLEAPKGERGRVLAAGGAGAILGTNLRRIGGPIVRNRERWGLRRVL